MTNLSAMLNSRLTLFVNIISALFIFLFAYTAVSKLLSMQLFRYVLSKSALIGNWAGFISWFIVFAEWIAAILLFYSPLRIAGLYITFFLMSAFSGYILIMLLASSALPCSCGGVLRQLSWQQHLWLNVLLTVLAGTGLIVERKRRMLLKYKTII